MASSIFTTFLCRQQRFLALTRSPVTAQLYTRLASTSVPQPPQTKTDLQHLKNLKVEYQDGIAVVQFSQENSKVNTLSRGMMDEFIPLFDHLQNDDKVKGIVVISAKPGSFIAGADINMLESAKSRDELFKISRNGQEIMNNIEQSRKPIVAAIAGSCLGGGFEVALACHYRIALNDKRTGFGVPEIKLGLLPGAGGTQRLVQKLSLPDALDLVLTGKEIKVKKAKSMGLVDDIVEPIGPGLQPTEQKNIDYLRSVAVQKAKDLTVRKPTKKEPGLVESIKSKIMSSSYVQNYIFQQATKKVMSQTQGLYPAPLKILDVIKQTVASGSKVGYNAEAEGFADLGMTTESKALISLFHGRTECKKNKYGKPVKEVKNVAVLGAGLMGAGIAHVSIDKGYNVILRDMTSKALSRGYTQISKGYQNYVKRKRITTAEYDNILSNLECQTTLANFGKCDMIIEAVFEDLQLKQKVLAEIEQNIPEHCVFASNTSALPIHQIAANSRRPEKVVGMHYFSPVDKMELLEIVRAKKTSDDTIRSAVSVGLKQGKVVIVVGDGPGFYTTRLLMFAGAEVFRLLQEGATPKDIDRATKKFGFPVGSATLFDEVGIDVAAHIARDMQTVFGARLGDSSMPQLFQDLVKNNLCGRKTGQGLYIYQAGVKGGDREINPKFTELIKNYSKEAKEKTTMENIQWRTSLRFLNEAARCLEEQIITSPTDGDIGAVFGLGFPPMKGGPFRFIDTYGVSNIVDLMNKHRNTYDERFAPTQLLVDMAKDNKKFYS
ncbi:unnamed protein product [Rotaria magnacalcarata]|uniref:enoyl-CoA hydratase n=2 Tax=Rotaria magnacalcarata TaxID=392030 RepID=A0A816QSE1_9BILA|nr:unnamed protein product [Rotaria magnacalcarata]